MKSLISAAAALALSAVMVFTQSAAPVLAATVSPAQAKLTITFDDGRDSNIQKAAPILAKYGLSATAFVVTDCVGIKTIPNKCRASQDVSYMSWNELRTLRDTYGWEIGSHSKTHPYMASKNPKDGQPRLLTPAQVAAELRDSKTALAAQGINATAFASPYGDYSMFSLREIAKYYLAHRGFADQNNNVWPYNDLILNNMQVQTPVLPSAVKAKIDTAITNKTWLILTLHDIVDKPQDPSTYAYDWQTSYFEEIAAYIKQKKDAGLITPVNMTGGLATGVNMLPGGDFTGGLTNGWRTDNAAAFATDSGNGALPNASGNIRLKASPRQAHLFAPAVNVNSSATYVFKSYLATTAIGGNEVGYYIDEYDASGNWISGQWKGAETSAYTAKFNFAYTPTSPAVKKAQLQIYMTPGTTLNGYLDSVEMFQVGAPIATPPPMKPINLLSNGSFDSGMTAWRTDNPTFITHNTASRGAPVNPINSVRIAGTNGARGHLFSSLVTVSPGTSYTLSNYTNIVSTTGGGLGWYIDEYDASGNWISGKFMKWSSTLGPQTTSFTYTPSSANVAKASYQLIAESGTQIEAYFDNPSWFKQ